MPKDSRKRSDSSPESIGAAKGWRVVVVVVVGGIGRPINLLSMVGQWTIVFGAF